MRLGLASLETHLSASSLMGAYGVGNAPTLADVCFAPQVFNGKRFDVIVEESPTLARFSSTAWRRRHFSRRLQSSQMPLLHEVRTTGALDASLPGSTAAGPICAR